MRLTAACNCRGSHLRSRNATSRRKGSGPAWAQEEGCKVATGGHPIRITFRGRAGHRSGPVLTAGVRRPPQRPKPLRPPGPAPFRPPAATGHGLAHDPPHRLSLPHVLALNPGRPRLETCLPHRDRCAGRPPLAPLQRLRALGDARREDFAGRHRLDKRTPLMLIGRALKCSCCGERKAHCWPEPFTLRPNPGNSKREQHMTPNGWCRSRP